MYHMSDGMYAVASSGRSSTMLSRAFRRRFGAGCLHRTS